jgi:hypothetical protein
MFHLTEAWAGHLDDELGMLGNTVASLLAYSRMPATFDNVREAVVRLADQRTRERKGGTRALAVSESLLLRARRKLPQPPE